jgi:outer membrane protein insertion porin family
MTSSISYEYTRNYELARNQYAELPDSTRDYNISAIQLSGFYTSNLKQDEGWAVRPYMEFSGLFGSASFEFQKLVLDLRRYVKLTGSTTLAGRVEMGSTFYHESDSLPNPVRFYTGGTNSVRGWNRHMLGPKRAVLDEDGQFQHYIPLGGRSKFMFNVELRQKLDMVIDGLGMALFLDGGQIWQRVEETAVKRPLRYGAGGGFRYDSPIGPVRVDLGYKLNPSLKDLDYYGGQDFGNFMNHIAVHFSIGQSF